MWPARCQLVVERGLKPGTLWPQVPCGPLRGSAGTWSEGDISSACRRKAVWVGTGWVGEEQIEWGSGEF